MKSQWLDLVSFFFFKKKKKDKENRRYLTPYFNCYFYFKEVYKRTTLKDFLQFRVLFYVKIGTIVMIWDLILSLLRVRF